MPLLGTSPEVRCGMPSHCMNAISTGADFVHLHQQQNQLKEGEFHAVFKPLAEIGP